MIYFTKELWEQINNCDENVRRRAIMIWEKNRQTYQKQFETVKPRLPSRFISAYIKRCELHDYRINEISIETKGRKRSCSLVLTSGGENIRLILKGISTISISVKSFECCILGQLTWGYSEFEIAKDGNIRLSVLCDGDNEMSFTFQHIGFRLEPNTNP